MQIRKDVHDAIGRSLHQTVKRSHSLGHCKVLIVAGPYHLECRVGKSRRYKRSCSLQSNTSCVKRRSVPGREKPSALSVWQEGDPIAPVAPVCHSCLSYFRARRAIHIHGNFFRAGSPGVAKCVQGVQGQLLGAANAHVVSQACSSQHAPAHTHSTDEPDPALEQLPVPRLRVVLHSLAACLIPGSFSNAAHEHSFATAQEWQHVQRAELAAVMTSSCKSRWLAAIRMRVVRR